MTRLLLLPFFLVLAGCLHPVEPPPAVPAVVVQPVSFEGFGARLSGLIAATTDADQRDRLLALRALLEDMRGADPAAQQVVHRYVERVLVVEERGNPVAIEAIEGGPVVAIADVPIEVPPTVGNLESARAAYASGQFAIAVAALDAIPVADPSAGEAVKLRKEVVDAWARAEREVAGEAFLKARALSPGPERAAALAAVREALVAINVRHPDNAYAEQIRENVTRVEAELAAAPNP